MGAGKGALMSRIPDCLSSFDPLGPGVWRTGSPNERRTTIGTGTVAAIPGYDL